jgi:hypothetical protein
MEKLNQSVTRVLDIIDDYMDKASPLKPLSYAARYSLLLIIITQFTQLIFASKNQDTNLLSALISVTICSLFTLILIRYYYKLDFTWSRYNKTSAVIVLINSLIGGLLLNGGASRGPEFIERIGFSIIFYVIAFVVCLIAGIFLERNTTKVKMKRLIGVILILWAIYKLVNSLNSENKVKGIDTDGDGVLDSFDTDGDGLIDTVGVDTDGDGVLDTLAMDTDGDGLVDSLAFDTDGDGLIDSVAMDTNGDGLVDSLAMDTDGDGYFDTVAMDTDRDGFIDSAVVDANGDGYADFAVTDSGSYGFSDSVVMDTDGDGFADTVAVDTDGDGLVDTIATDTDSDGIVDTIIMDTDGDGVADLGLKDRDGDGTIDEIV